MAELIQGNFSLFKKGIKNTKNAVNVDLMQAINMIRTEDGKDEILKLRTIENASTKKVIKEHLDYFTFSGTFNTRENSKILKHSNIIAIDFDDVQELQKTKYALTKDPFTLCIFVSPSGTGLKLLAKINGAMHLESFLFLEAYYEQKFDLIVDKACKDVARACFISYDPEIFFNTDSKMVFVEPNSDIDYESGEVTERIVERDSDPKTFKRAIQVVNRISEARKDLTGDYQDWLEIGLALATFGEEGRSLFHKISIFHPDYTEQSTDAKFTNFLKTGRFSNPAKLFAIAKNNGIETKYIRNVSGATAEGAEGADYQDWEFSLPDDVEMTDQFHNDAFNYHFIEHKNRYYYAHFDLKTRKVSFFPISNFVVKPLFLILSKTDPKRLFEIINFKGDRYIIDMPAKALVSITEFCVFVESQGNFLLEANKTQFHKIKSKLYDLTKNAEEIKTLGWHKDGFYAFSNGVFKEKFYPVNEHGIITKNIDVNEEEAVEKNFFIPAMSSIYKDEDDLYENEKKFKYIPRDVSFEKWASLFFKVHKSNGYFGICYYMTSLFRDIVYSRFKFFPHLFGFGPPGTGKSTMGWSLAYLFGLERKPFNLNAGTAVGFHRTFAQFRNAVVWFDEYANTIDFKRVQDLKSAYDGAGHVKGEWSSGGGSSNKTTTTPVHSACYISGQELPIADNALFKRCILLQFYQTEYTEQETKDAQELIKLQEKGLSHITGAMTIFRDKVEKNFFQNFDTVLKDLKVRLDLEENIEERIIQNSAIIMTVFKVLENDLKLPFTYAQLKEATIQNIKTQNALIANAKETNQFWDQVDYLLNSQQIKYGEDFKIEYKSRIKIRINRNESADKEFTAPADLLYLRLNKIHPLYMQSLRQQGEKKGMDKGSLVHYLSNSKGYVGAVDKTTFRMGDHAQASSAYVFDYAMLEGMGYNFKRDMEGLDDDDDNKIPIPNPFSGIGYNQPNVQF